MDSRLFEDLVVSQAHVPRGGGIAFPASAALHATLLSAAIVIPLLTPGRLPDTPILDVVPLPPVPVVMQAAVTQRPTQPPKPGGPPATHAGLTVSRPPQMPFPTGEPDTLPGPGDEDLPGGCLVGCAPVGTSLGPDVTGPGPEAPPETVIRLSRGVRPPAKLRHLDPVYPDAAKRIRLQGTVELECTIGPDGRVTDVRVVSGPPLLDAAAAEAVRQWIYTPTLLNGVPVPVILTVSVRFQLN